MCALSLEGYYNTGSPFKRYWKTVICITRTITVKQAIAFKMVILIHFILPGSTVGLFALKLQSKPLLNYMIISLSLQICLSTSFAKAFLPIPSKIRGFVLLKSRDPIGRTLVACKAP